MNPGALDALVWHLESTASALVAAPDIASMLANLEDFPSAISQLPDLLENPALSAPEKLGLQSSLRDCLVHLQRAALYANTRLQHEHESLHAQLTELSSQLQWAQRARQSI